MSDILHKMIRQYRIIEEVGKGGMAAVYKAYDNNHKREVAIKVISTEYIPQGAIHQAFKRFERETKILLKLDHANIVKIFDYGEYDGMPFLAMEYHPVGTLNQRLGKAIPWSETIQTLLPIAKALSYAHKQGVVHRDLKPSNILITKSGDLTLADFGIAKIVLDSEETAGLTGTGVKIGTPQYMSPEQLRGRDIDARTDIYSFGVILYECITGRIPYEGNTLEEIMLEQATEQLPNLRRYAKKIPQKIEDILHKSLAKDPASRYPDMESFIKDMEASVSEWVLISQKPFVLRLLTNIISRTFSETRRSWLEFVIKGFFFPCFDLSFYVEGVAKKNNIFLFYLIFTVALALVPTFQVAEIIYINGIKLKSLYARGEIPAITISDGIAKSNPSKPYIYIDNTSIFAIDTTGEMKRIDPQYISGVLITYNELHQLTPSGYRVNKLAVYNQLFGDPISVNAANISDYFNKILIWGTVATFFAVTMWNVLAKICFILLAGLLLWQFALLLKKQASYKSVIITGIFANVPATYTIFMLKQANITSFILFPVILLIVWAIALREVLKTMNIQKN